VKNEQNRECLICGSSSTTVKQAVISDFLLERIWDNKIDKQTELIFCSGCGFAFYSLRPTDEEMSRLYSGYRNEQYQEQRQRFESWYTEEVNNCREDAEAYESRQEHMRRIILDAVDVSTVRSVLDYGGDTGLNIPRVFSNAEKYVFDISGVEPEAGVTGIADPDELRKRKYDFIMNTAVLEHVSDPYRLLKNISEVSKDGGLIYLEVPFDSPFYKRRLDDLQFLFNKKFSKKVIFEQFLRTLRTPYIMHEHLNFFTPRSFEIMVRNAGWEIMDTRVEKVRNPIVGRTRILSLLARTK